MLLRLSAPESERLLQSARLTARFGGAEANVAVSLASLGHAPRMITALPDNAIGQAAAAELNRNGVDARFVVSRPGRMGLYFLTPGAVVRPSDVLYDRSGSAFAETQGQAFGLDDALSGCGWLHLSGITPAVSANAAQAALMAVFTAQELGLSVSFDGNYRAKMWAAWGGQAAEVLAELIGGADLLFGNELDIGLALGRSFDEPNLVLRRQQAAAAAFEAFPRLKRICSTFRTEHSVSRHEISAMMATREALHLTPIAYLEAIVDRIGTGDAFAAGVLHGLISGWDDVRALHFGWAACAYKHSIPGDFNLASEADIEDVLSGSGVHVRR
jgi:2-dehydro-3-deoxygluconokinase